MTDIDFVYPVLMEIKKAGENGINAYNLSKKLDINLPRSKRILINLLNRGLIISLQEKNSSGKTIIHYKISKNNVLFLKGFIFLFMSEDDLGAILICCEYRDKGCSCDVKDIKDCKKMMDLYNMKKGFDLVMKGKNKMLFKDNYICNMKKALDNVFTKDMCKNFG